MALVLVPPMARLPIRPRGAAVRMLSGSSMGTTWSARIAAADVELGRVQAAIQVELDLVEAQMSPWRAESALAQFNAAPPGSVHQLPAEMAQVLALALDVAGQTAGAFDPTLGRLTDLWGFGPAPFPGTPPDPASLSAARDDAGWTRLQLDGGWLQRRSDLALDLCGVAKGYAVDRAARAIEAAGVASYLLEVGGEVRGCGVKPDMQPWWVALEHPADAGSGEGGDDRLLIAACGIAIATSGGVRRHFEHEGRRYSHTLDAATGAPVEEAVLAATVLHACCATADALATALIVMGEDAACGFAERRGLAAVLTIAGGAGPRRRLSPAAEEMAIQD